MDTEGVEGSGIQVDPGNHLAQHGNQGVERLILPRHREAPKDLGGCRGSLSLEEKHGGDPSIKFPGHLVGFLNAKKHCNGSIHLSCSKEAEAEVAERLLVIWEIRPGPA